MGAGDRTPGLLVRIAFRTVLASGRVPGRPGRLLRAALAGIWLGLLSDPQVAALNDLYYDCDDTYRSRDWNERGLAPWEREAIESCQRPGSRIVVVACGGGREVLALAQQGFDAIGYEPDPALCAVAQLLLAEHGHSGRVWPSEHDRFPDSGPCDGVLVGWGAYSLITPRQARVALLRDATGSGAANGGPIVLSFFARDRPSRGLRLTTGLARALRRRLRRSGVELGDTLAPNRVHVFTREELSTEFREAGMALAAYRVFAAVDPVTSYAYAIARPT